MSSDDHAVVPSRDWLRQGAHALCTCGSYRCSVLIERGELTELVISETNTNEPVARTDVEVTMSNQLALEWGWIK